jgi:prophage regulatory protein
MINAILSLPDVKKYTGLSRSTIYLRIAQGNFPKQLSLRGRSIGWLQSEIEEWLSNKIAESRKINN